MRYVLSARLFGLPGVLHAISIQECPHGIVPDCSSHAKHGFIDWNNSPSGRVVSIKYVWQPPALPCRLQHSTIGRTDLHRRVRDGNGCALRTHRHQTDLSMKMYLQPFGKLRVAPPFRLPRRSIHSHHAPLRDRSSLALLYAHVWTLVKASRMPVRARHPLSFSSLFSSHENPTETQPLLSSLERR